MKTRCAAPAKLILSGEHAVLYGCPALSMAIQLPTHCEVSFQPDNKLHLDITLTNFQQQHTLSGDKWLQHATEIEQRFSQYQNQQLDIQSVLRQPIDLILTTLYHYHQLHVLPPGKWDITLYSDAPTGRGLGSSAAIIISLLKALNQQLTATLDRAALLALAQTIECRQHGKSSGIDPATIIYGGLLQYQTERPIEPIASHPLQGWLIDTGLPQSTTGECVDYVRKHHANDKPLWQSFRTVTEAIATAWRQQDSQALRNDIQRNQRLLTQIGIVPKQVQNWVQLLENNYQAAVKICGAGSIKGDTAGMLLVLCERSPVDFCEQHNLALYPLTLSPEGALCDQS